MKSISKFNILVNSANPILYKKLKILIPLTILSSCLEALGVGLIMPLVSVLIDPNSAQEFIREIGYEKYLTASNAAIYIAALVGILFVSKALINMLTIVSQNNFAFELQKSLSSQLIKKYLRMDQQIATSKNSSHLIASAVNEVNIISQHFILPLLILLGELFVVLMVLLVIISVNPLASILAMIIFLAPSYYLYRTYSPKNMYLGQQRQKLEGQKIRYVQEILSLRLTIILSGINEFFEERFQLVNSLHADSTKKQFIIQQHPRVFLELIAVSSILTIIFLMKLSGQENSSIVPILGLFAAAAFRLFPSVSRILWANQNIKYSNQFVENILQLMDDEEIIINKSGKSSTEKFLAIELKNVSFKYKNSTEESLTNINFKIRKGEFIGIMGESGAGKSTILSILLGFLKPTRGEILINGKNADQNYYWNLIGYVPQDVKLIDDTIRNNITLGQADALEDKEKIIEVINKSQLQSFVNSLLGGVEENVGENGSKISGGQKQRIGIARALYRGPQLLILDEATNSLDKDTEQEILNTLLALKGKIAILMITHNQSLYPYFDRRYQINRGKINEK